MFKMQRVRKSRSEMKTKWIKFETKIMGKNYYLKISLRASKYNLLNWHGLNVIKIFKSFGLASFFILEA